MWLHRQSTSGSLPPNNRIQASAGGAAVLNSRVGRAPAAPDAGRWAVRSQWEERNGAMRHHVSTHQCGPVSLGIIRLRRLALVLLSCTLLMIGSRSPSNARDRASIATFEITSITPPPDTQVSQATIMKATLRYTIENFSDQSRTYAASLMFDDPMGSPDNGARFSDYGCHGARQELKVASGTVDLECRLSEVWSKFRHSKSLGVRFVITQYSGRPNGGGLVRSESVHYDIQR